MTTSHGFVQSRGLRLHHLDHGGSGTPIVLIHGVTGHAWIWNDVAESLTAIGRPIAFDLRGFGESQWSASGSYSTDDHAADLEAVISSIGGEPVDLVGASWGGLVAIAFAAGHPGLVRRLALVDVAPSSSQSEDDVPPMPYDFADHAGVLAAERAANPNAPDASIEVAAAHGTRPGEGGRLYRTRDPLFMRKWPFRADDRWEQLASLDLPILVIHATDSFIPREVADRMVKTARRASLVEIEHSTHVVPLENPSALSDALIAFLAE